LLKGLENQLIEFLTTFYTSVGWTGVLLMMAIESMMIPLPSEIIMPLAGWLLIHEVAGSSPLWLQIVFAGFVGGLGCLLGSVIAYGIGRAGGRPLVIKYGKYVLINTNHLDIAERWLQRWGSLATFISRILPVVRTFISLPAGVVRTPFISFCIYTFVGSFLWCLGLAWIGNILGPKYEELRESIGWLDYPIALIILGLVVWFVWHTLKARKKGPPAGLTESEQAEINPAGRL
jgi:membrane protein DedA with SNARE-associated domain